MGGSLEEPAADAAVVARRNELVDAFLARLSDAIKQSHDPMKIVFKKSGKVILRPEGKNKRNKKKFRRRLHKKGKRGKKGRGGRHPKSLTPQQEQEEKNKILGEERENGEDGAAADDEDTLSEADGEEEAGVEFYVYDEDAEEGRPVANETEGRRPLDEADYEDEDSVSLIRCKTLKGGSAFEGALPALRNEGNRVLWTRGVPASGPEQLWGSRVTRLP